MRQSANVKPTVVKRRARQNLKRSRNTAVLSHAAKVKRSYPNVGQPAAELRQDA